MDLLDRVRASCAEVARRARFVRIEEPRLAALARELAAAAPEPDPGLDPAHHFLGDASTTLAYVLTLDAVNFGSGWFPHLTKRPGLSGYFTVATSLKEHFEARGPWSARALAELTAADCARVLGQDRGVPEVAELTELFARALRDLGAFLETRFGGRFEGPVEAAGGRAARLAARLAEMAFYRDVAHYDGVDGLDGPDGLEVAFYKRAQLTCADLALAFDGRGPGRFEDLDRLTLFADNLVPHVLRCEGALRYAPGLARRIDAGERLEAGSPEEVEIRAVAVHAVERCVALAREAGVATSAWRLDQRLWNRGQRPGLKARPRHRARCVYY